MEKRVETIRRIPQWLQLLALAALAVSSDGIAQTTGAPVTTSFSGLVYNRATQTFNSTLTLTNSGPTLAAPLSITIATGSPSVTVKGATAGGMLSVSSIPNGVLPPKGTVQIPVAFVDPARVAFTPTVSNVAGRSYLTFIDPNPGDSVIAMVDVTGQNLVTYSGTKTSAGAVQASAVVVDAIDQSPSQRVVLTLDSLGRPINATLGDGSSVSLAYISPSQINFTVTDKVGERGTVSYNPSTSTFSAAATQPAAAIVAGTGSQGSSYTGSVNVSCPLGTPITNASVTGSYLPNEYGGGPNTNNLTVPIIPSQVGASSFTYPAPSAPLDMPVDLLGLAQTIQNNLEPLVSGICNISGGLKDASASSLSAVVAGTTAGVLLLAEFPVAIPAVIRAIEAVCTANTALTGTINVLQIIDVMQSGGSITFTANRPQAQPISATMAYGGATTQPPNFTLTGPCDVVSIAPPDAHIAVGQTIQMAATAKDSETGAPVAISPVWTIPSSASGVAAIGPDGLVVAYGVGATTITASDPVSGAFYIAGLTVSDLIPHVSVSINPTPTPFGKPVTFTVVVTPPTGAPAGSPVPTGTVGSDPSGICSAVPLDATGTAICLVASAEPDTQSTTAVFAYSGDSNYAAASANATLVSLPPSPNGTYVGTCGPNSEVDVVALPSVSGVQSFSIGGFFIWSGTLTQTGFAYWSLTGTALAYDSMGNFVYSSSITGRMEGAGSSASSANGLGITWLGSGPYGAFGCAVVQP
jgi:Bacterial Ig-like domain (group 3)